MRVRVLDLVGKSGFAWQGKHMGQLIMIIDDEVGVRDLLGDALKLAGFETVAATDAMNAQTLLRTVKPVEIVQMSQEVSLLELMTMSPNLLVLKS